MVGGLKLWVLREGCLSGHGCTVTGTITNTTSTTSRTAAATPTTAIGANSNITNWLSGMKGAGGMENPKEMLYSRVL